MTACYIVKLNVYMVKYFMRLFKRPIHIQHTLKLAFICTIFSSQPCTNNFVTYIMHVVYSTLTTAQILQLYISFTCDDQ